jgi:hypothetical protein
LKWHWNIWEIARKARQARKARKDCLSRRNNFPFDRRNFYDKVPGEWSSFAPLGAPRPHQPSALGLVGAFF